MTRSTSFIEDVGADPRFAVDQAQRTGYVPKGLMAAPLLREDRVLGVLNVLDRPERRRFSVAEMELLALFADQAAVALDLLLNARRIERVLWNDPASGVMRHADAGYQEAIACAKAHGLELPSVS